VSSTRDQVDAARALIAKAGPFPPEDLKGRLPATQYPAGPVVAGIRMTLERSSRAQDFQANPQGSGTTREAHDGDGKGGQVSDVAVGTGKVVQAGDKTLALFNLDGTFYALDNRCTHAFPTVRPISCAVVLPEGLHDQFRRNFNAARAQMTGSTDGDFRSDHGRLNLELLSPRIPGTSINPR
jgi:hypothetical protein